MAPASPHSTVRCPRATGSPASARSSRPSNGKGGFFDTCRMNGSCCSALERRHVDGEAVFHIRFQQSLISFVDLLDRDDFNVGGDVVLAAEVEHLLRLRDAANQRT